MWNLGVHLSLNTIVNQISSLLSNPELNITENNKRNIEKKQQQPNSLGRRIIHMISKLNDSVWYRIQLISLAFYPVSLISIPRIVFFVEAKFSPHRRKFTITLTAESCTIFGNFQVDSQLKYAPVCFYQRKRKMIWSLQNSSIYDEFAKIRRRHIVALQTEKISYYRNFKGKSYQPYNKKNHRKAS